LTHLKLPRFQYTAREPVSGACFTGYADGLSKSYATFLAEQLSVHLAGQGVDLSCLTWQTDNGCEFLENQEEQGLPAAVRALGSNPRYIPPKRYTWQSDVETVHRLVEDEFFDRESFKWPGRFLAQGHHLLVLLQPCAPQSRQGMAKPSANLKRQSSGHGRSSPQLATAQPLETSSSLLAFPQPQGSRFTQLSLIFSTHERAENRS
jgi:hypothetical protein